MCSPPGEGLSCMSKHINESERRKTERRRTKRRLVDESSVEILEHMSDAFTALDREWRLTYVNRVAERITRLRCEEMLGRVVWEVFPEYTPEFEGACRRAIDEGVTARYEEYYAPLDAWFEYTAAIRVDVCDADDASKLSDKCRRAGLLVMSEDEALTMFPVLNIDQKTARDGLDILAECL